MIVPLFANRPSLLAPVFEYCEEAITVVVSMICSLVLPYTWNALPYISSPGSILITTSRHVI